MRVAEARAQRNHEFEGTGDAENHAGAFAVETAALAAACGVAGARRLAGVSGIARVEQRPLRRDEGEQLRRVRGLDVFRRNAEFHRIEIDRRQEAATLRIGVVGRFRIGVEIIRRVPVRADRNRRDRIHAILDIRPIGLQVVRFGKQTTHADDGQGAGRLFAH